jgi:hypothetical protein
MSFSSLFFIRQLFCLVLFESNRKHFCVSIFSVGFMNPFHKKREPKEQILERLLKICEDCLLKRTNNKHSAFAEEEKTMITEDQAGGPSPPKVQKTLPPWWLFLAAIFAALALWFLFYFFLS